MPTSSTGDGRGEARRAGGFTLVELIVVIVLVGVLSGMIVPRLYSATRPVHLRSAAGRLLLAAQYARNFAVTRRCACRLLIDREQGRYELACQKDPAARPGEFAPLAAGIGRSEHLGGPVRFGRVWIAPAPQAAPLSGQAPACAVTFGATGRADAAVVEVTDGRRTVSMLVAPSTGQARLTDGVVDELPNDRIDLDG